MGNQFTKKLIIVTPDHQVHNIPIHEDIIRKCGYFNSRKEYEGKYICSTRLDVSQKDVIDFICLTVGEEVQNYNKSKVYAIAKQLQVDNLHLFRIDCLMSDDQEFIDLADEDQIDMCRAVDKIMRLELYSNKLLSHKFKDYDLLLKYLSVSDSVHPYKNRDLQIIRDLETVPKSAHVLVYNLCRPNVSIHTPCGIVNIKSRMFEQVEEGKFEFMQSLNLIEWLLIATMITPL